VVGGGLAGGRATELLARKAAPGEVVLVGDEPVAPYSRPMVSKELLSASPPIDPSLRPAEFYTERGVDLMLGTRAEELDPERREVTLSNGERIGFGRMLVATGARPVRLPVPGAELAGVHYVRDLADAGALAAELVEGRTALIVGAGFVGLEVAAACRARQVGVVMVEAAGAPCSAALGDEVGSWLGEVHRSEGVELRTATTVASLHGDGDRVERALLSDGSEVRCDFAVVGIGVEPATSWLEGSGVELDDGIVVDEHCESSVEGVYAAGDVARWPHPGIGRHLRVEHETNAQTQGTAAAASMLGRARPYAPLPYVWSRQYDLDLWAVGDFDGWEQLSLEEGPGERSLLATYLREGRPRAYAGVNRPEDLERARRQLADALADREEAFDA
jgi:3-phenylpropionate/trans-cinnamate dioxygenase ferredoxin reductase subunit